MVEISFTYEGRTFTFVHSNEDDHIFKEMKRTDSFYEIGLLENLRAYIREGDRVLDVGANIGTHSVYFAGVCSADVVAFEPNESARVLLERNIVANRLGERVHILPYAAERGEFCDHIRHVQKDNLGTATVMVGEGPIRIVPIDGLHLADPIRLMKIDAEGMEEDVLLGALDLLKRQRPVLVVGTKTEIELARIRQIIEPLGYFTVAACNWTTTCIFINIVESEQLAFLCSAASRVVSSLHFSHLELREQVHRVFRELANVQKNIIDNFSTRITKMGDALLEGDANTDRLCSDILKSFADARAVGETADWEAAVQAAAVQRRQVSDGFVALTDRVDSGLRQIAARVVELGRTVSEQREASRSELEPAQNARPPDAALSGLTDVLESLLRVLITNDLDASRAGARATPAVKDPDRYEGICFYHRDLSSDWGEWAVEQQVQLEKNGRLVVQQAHGAPGVRSRALGVVGGGLHEIELAFALPLAPQDSWFVRVCAPDGELMRTDTPVSGLACGVRFYVPRRIDEIEIRVLTAAPTIGITATFAAVWVSRLDDEAFYRRHRDVIGAPIYASMASVPSRETMLYDAVHSLLPQCDIVRVYLNNYQHAPSFLDHPRVEVRRSQDFDDIGDAGKFGWVGNTEETGYRIICDDDLLYPMNLVERLVGAVRQTDDKAMVGLHGVLVRQPFDHYYEPHTRHAVHFQSALTRTKPVHVLATCVMCAHHDSLRLAFHAFMFRNMADIWLAKHAQTNAIPLLIIDRPAYWVRENKQSTRYDTIYDHSLRKTRSRFDSSHVQDAVLKSMQPFSFIGVVRPVTVLISFIDASTSKASWLQSLLGSKNEAFDWKYVFLYRDPDAEGVRHLKAAHFQDEQHFLEMDDTLASRWRLSALLEAMRYDVGVLAHARIDFRNADWSRDALGRFMASSALQMRFRKAPGGLVETSKLAEDFHFAFFRGGIAFDQLFGDGPPGQDVKTAPVASSDPAEGDPIIERLLSFSLDVAAIGDDDGLADLGGATEDRAARLTVSSRRQLSQFFDRAVMLNLDSRPDRWDIATQQLQRVGIEPIRHRAVDVSWEEIQREYKKYAFSPLRRLSGDIPMLKTEEEFYLRARSEAQRTSFIETSKGKKAIPSAGAWGYLTTMIQILESALLDGVETLLICDDDIVLHNDAESIFERAVSELPSDWLILQLGTLQYNWSTDWISWRGRWLYSQKGSTIGSYAVGLRREVLPFLLERAKRMELAYDVGPLSAATRAFPDRNFVVFPNIAIQLLADSDVGALGCQASRDIDSIWARYKWGKGDYVLS